MVTQKDFLLKLEDLCGIKKPVFINDETHTREGFAKSYSQLVTARHLTVEHSVGRMRLTQENSAISEIWIDIDNHDGIKYAVYKKERLQPAVQKLLSFGIPADCIFPKVSGRGVHLHVFISGLPPNMNVKELFAKTVDDDSDARSKVEKTKLREFGAKTRAGKSYTSYVRLEELNTARKLPEFDKPEYPNIKLFKATKDFLQKVSCAEMDKKQATIEKDVTVDYERDGDFMKFYNCNAIKMLARKAEIDKHLLHDQRFFLMSQFIHFGEESRKHLHEIMKHCSDYDEDYTQSMINHAMESGYHPCTCKWAHEHKMPCGDCKSVPNGNSPIKLVWTPLTLKEIKDVYHKWLCFKTPKKFEDDEILDVAFAVKIERKFKGDPIWLLLVADSGGTKSEILRSITFSEDTVDLDSITSHTLISGKVIPDPESGKLRPVKGLLSQLDGKTLIIKDFTIILQSDPKERYLVFSQFRGAYDGYYASAFGTWDKPIKIDCIFTVMTGVTRAIDVHGNLAVILGERFLKLRHDIDRKLATFAAMRNAGKEKQMRRELSSKTERFLLNLNVPEDVEMPETIFNQILYLALFIAQIRMPIPQSSWKSTMLGMEAEFETAPEYATRLGKQLLKLAKLLSIVRGRQKVTDEDFLTTLRVGFNTCPQNRIKLALYLYYNPQSTIEEISKGLRWRIDKTRRLLATLAALDDVLAMTGEISAYETKYEMSITIKEYLRNFLQQIGEYPIFRMISVNLLKHKNTLNTPSYGHGKSQEILMCTFDENPCDDSDMWQMCQKCPSLRSCDRVACRFAFMHMALKCACSACNRPSPRYPMTRWCADCVAAGHPIYTAKRE